MNSDPLETQRDVGTAVVSELSAAGFRDAEEVGRGGFGIVFRCNQAALDRMVAVKVLTTQLDEDRDRFLREQRAMGVLTGHPNIVGVLQVGETSSGYPYLVMQYHRHGSLDIRIREHGALAHDEVLQLGVKLAGALETAHRAGILHRDIKPANILYTDFGEPALSDFGIAHVTGGFKTATGVFTGSPAFTAPEILSGGAPSPASDIYGLGATLFAALTGHAAFERRSGEQVVAQFLRIASESAPDLRENGVPDDVAALVEMAMARDPRDRPSVVELCTEIQRVQRRHGLPVDEMALRSEPQAEQPARQGAKSGRTGRTLGNMPLELTSFVGRRSELSEAQKALSAGRLVTLTGIGGVGKTRMALRIASEVRTDFPDGVWLVELGELRDGSLLIDVVTATLGVRDRSARSPAEVLIEFLATRQLLLVLDNCEQVVDEAAKLAETLLRSCPEIRILSTSREALGIGGETVLPLAPLPCPGADSEPTPPLGPGNDAVALFAERAATAVPGFALTTANTPTIAQICSRLDGLPLAIELAAARLRAMSPEQVLDRLSDRFALLTRGSRHAPTRQQTLSWSIGWSYDLCTPEEKRLWERLSVFSGSFELQAAESICGDNLSSDDFLDVVSSLVDKSILLRTEEHGVVRLRLLDTLRDYGRERLDRTDEYAQLRRRHCDWYRQLAHDAEAGWFSASQVQWLDRVQHELSNLREALEFSISEGGQAALDFVADLHQFWFLRGPFSEARRWLDRALAAAPKAPTTARARALYAACMIAATQGDIAAATALAAEGRELVLRTADPVARAAVAVCDGFAAIASGQLDHACACLQDAIDEHINPTMRAGALIVLGWAQELRGDSGAAVTCYEAALALSESHGESMYRSLALLSMGVAKWRSGEGQDAIRLLRQSLELVRVVNDRRTAAYCLETLAWIAAETGGARVAAVMLGAAAGLSRAVGSASVPFAHLYIHHDEGVRLTQIALGTREFDLAHQEGGALSFDEAIRLGLEAELDDGPEPRPSDADSGSI
ncbi:serine/threonine protein kinase [Mycolicibacterium rhodesiae JS60]|nr:serine/threonine protein kinase [Mycolicibacterium rhodesiae JS60]